MAKHKWSTKLQIGLYKVSWTSKGIRKAVEVAASDEATAVKQAYKACAIGNHQSVQVEFLG